jgi:hypothetical protein
MLFISLQVFGGKVEISLKNIHRLRHMPKMLCNLSTIALELGVHVLHFAYFHAHCQTATFTGCDRWNNTRGGGDRSAARSARP